MVTSVLSFKPRRLPSHLSGLVAERARADGHIGRLQLLIDDLQAELQAALTTRESCDVLIAKAFAASPEIDPVAAWRGRYGKRGAIRNELTAYLAAAYPEAKTSKELAAHLCQALGIDFPSQAAASKWIKTNVNGSLTIRIDGRDVRSMSVNEQRAVFGVVPQESVLFTGTIIENLMAVAADATFERAVVACKMAGIHQVIENLPEGYQTKLGERGAGLSGGQRQRLAIARALLKRPRVLVFDEAVASLDDESAEQVAKAVNEVRGKVTVLFITHKVPKALMVDQHLQLG